MRRLEQLIKSVRFHTDEESNRFSDIKFNKIFTDAQTEIVRVINVKNSSNSYFTENVMYDLTVGQSEYELPSDVYVRNSINAVFRKLKAGVSIYNSYEPLRLVSIKELGRSSGYIIQDNKILLSLLPTTSTTDGLIVNYTKRIPTLSIRYPVKSIVGQDIRVSGFDTEVDYTDYSDYICIVDKYGAIIDEGLEVDKYANGKFTVTGTITATDGYVVIGEYATSHSTLPLECEKYLTMFVERMVHYINSNRNDYDVASIFTAQEKSDIEELFADPESDVKYPPIVDSTYLN